MTSHPSVTVCEMCGLLIGDRDIHNAWHVKLHDHDVNVLSAIDAAAGAIESVSTLQDIDGERLEKPIFCCFSICHDKC